MQGLRLPHRRFGSTATLKGREIDFVEIRDGRIHLFEVKWLESADPRWIAILREAAGALARSKVYALGDSHLMCRTASSFAQDGVQVVHPAEFFLAT